MKPSHKYWIFILAIVCAVFGVVGASVVGSWLNLTDEEQTFVIGLADKILPFPLIGAFVLVAVIGGLVSLLFRYYIIPILQLAESTQLITLSNPDHRIHSGGAREVVRLAEVINSSADAFQKLQSDVDAAIRSAQADLKEERNRFAALMSELPAGVLVCNRDGQILLYNQQAQSLLNHTGSGDTCMPGPTVLIGLGRSLFGILQREQVINGMKLLQQAVTDGETTPTTRFTHSLASGRSLRVTMAPVFSFRCEEHEECLQCERRKMTGMVLTFDDGGDDIQGEQLLPALVKPGLAAIQGSRPVYYEFDLFNQQNSEEIGKQPLRRLTYVVFDTETTGLEPAKGDEIIQIGAVRIVNGRIMQDEVIDQLIDPQRSIPETSVAIHGITPEMVAGQPIVEQVLPYFKRFTEGAVLVAHNAAFDMRCLQLKGAQTGIHFDVPVLDTLLLSSIVHPHQETHGIEGLARRLNLTISGRHTALGDAIVTAEVFLKLIPLLESCGILTLDDALQASKNSPFAKISY